MLWSEWFDVTVPDTIGVLLSVAVVYTLILIYTRVFGLRSFDEVRAVVFETTGDVSVLHGEPDRDFDDRLLFDLGKER